MASDNAIIIENLSKGYRIYDKPIHRLLQMVCSDRKHYYRVFWSLKDISLVVKRGETVGIVGKNGAGKSTLLKIICGTTAPTAGTVTTNGRIAAILELDAGFNPEFTGRENVFMKASILGLTNEEINSCYDSIIAFAEIGDFIDQPVKTYSSGMIVRLAFSVAINADPEILVVDEALAVGDEKFQRKCYARLETIRRQGATIIFVSHSGETVVHLCDRAILLDKGEMLVTAKPKIVYDVYQQLLYAPDGKREAIRNNIIELGRASENYIDNDIQEESLLIPDNTDGRQEQESFDPLMTPSSVLRYVSQGAVIRDPAILTSDGRKVNCLVRRKRYRYTYYVDFQTTATKLQFGMLIKSDLGIALGGATTAYTNLDSKISMNTGTTCRVVFEFTCFLNEGTYFLNAGVSGMVGEYPTNLHRVVDLAMFKVVPDPESSVTGMVDFVCDHSTVLISGTRKQYEDLAFGGG
jgi:lipopolysaccharide transport system ATP-binding protein